MREKRWELLNWNFVSTLIGISRISLASSMLQNMLEVAEHVSYTKKVYAPNLSFVFPFHFRPTPSTWLPTKSWNRTTVPAQRNQRDDGQFPQSVTSVRTTTSSLPVIPIAATTTTTTIPITAASPAATATAIVATVAVHHPSHWPRFTLPASPEFVPLPGQRWPKRPRCGSPRGKSSANCLSSHRQLQSIAATRPAILVLSIHTTVAVAVAEAMQVWTAMNTTNGSMLAAIAIAIITRRLTSGRCLLKVGNSL